MKHCTFHTFGRPRPAGVAIPRRASCAPRQAGRASRPPLSVGLAHPARAPFDSCLSLLASLVAPGRSRTCDQQLRRLLLYPTELRALLVETEQLYTGSGRLHAEPGGGDEVGDARGRQADRAAPLLGGHPVQMRAADGGVVGWKPLSEK